MAVNDPVESAPIDNERLIEELREALRARDELLDIADHELRTPMAALLVQVEDALRLTQPHETELVHRLERLERIIERTVRRATLLLEASRLNAGTYRPAAEPVNLLELVSEAAQTHAAQARHCGVKLCMLPSEAVELVSDRT